MLDERVEKTLVGCTRKGCKGTLCPVHRVREVVAYRCDKCGRRIEVPKQIIGTESKR